MDQQELQYRHLVDIGDGQYVERDVLNVIERIRNYDPNIRVKYLNRAETTGDAPWCLTEMCRDGVERLCFYAWTMDERVLERLYNADTHRFDVLGRLENNNARLKREAHQRYKETVADSRDMLEHALRSNKGRYSIRIDDKLIHIDDDPTSGPAKVILDKD